MPIENLEKAFLEQLRDIYWAEKKIAKSLPKMAKTAESDELRKAFETHQQQTEQQILRLEQVFETLDQKPRAKKCEAMEGIMKEGDEILGEEGEPIVKDAMLIGAAQKVEHYEIATYGTLCTWAEQIGCSKKAINLLKANLKEEKETDELLTGLAEQSINKAAVA